MTESLPTSLQDFVGGSFHKTALLQKRVRELIKGATPLIETREKNPIKVAFLEMQGGLIELTPEEEGQYPPMDAALLAPEVPRAEPARIDSAV